MPLPRRTPDPAQGHQAGEHFHLQKLERQAGRLRAVEGAVQRVDVRVHERGDAVLHVAGADQRGEVQPQERHLVARLHHLRDGVAEAAVPGRELLLARAQDQRGPLRPRPESLLRRPAARRRADAERRPGAAAVGDGAAGAPEGGLQDQRGQAQGKDRRSQDARGRHRQARKGRRREGGADGGQAGEGRGAGTRA